MRKLTRTFRRLTFNLLVMLSLVLCAGVVAAWADSYRGMRMIQITRSDQELQWASRDGMAVLHWNRGPDGEFRWQRPTQRFQVLGLSYSDGRLVRRKPWSMLMVPYWIPTMLLLILPAAWVVLRYRAQARRERVAQGLCPRCGTRVDAAGACPGCAAVTSRPPPA